MGENRVSEIEEKIGALSQPEFEELLTWLDQYTGPQPLDRRIEADLATGRLDAAVREALDDERQGRVRPL
jgi:hypothetical protein